MPICGKCGKTLLCNTHGEDTGSQVLVVGSTTLPCQDKAEIWVRVRDHLGAPLPKVSVEVSGVAKSTAKNGFVTYPDLPAIEHEARITLTGGLEKQYKIKDPTLKQMLAKGEVKLFSFNVLPRAKPVIVAPKAAAVKGVRQSIQLSADAAYEGKGVFTCTANADKVLFHYDGRTFSGTHTFPAITEAAITLEVEALDGSPLDGVKLEWRIDDSDDPATAVMTAVKAALTVYKKSDAPLPEPEKLGDGRVVHKQLADNSRTRAKIKLDVTPPEFAGELGLTTTNPGKVTLFSAAKDGRQVAFGPLKTGAGEQKDFYLEGTDVSGAKADIELQLTIKDLADRAPVDTAKFTVVMTTLQIGAPRVTSDADSLPMPHDTKLAVGRLLYKHRTPSTEQRALLRLTKEPIDAPCELRLAAKTGADKVALFEASWDRVVAASGSFPDKTFQSSNEFADKKAKPIDAWPRVIAADEVKDKTAGLVFWVNGIKESTDREVRWQVDAVDVDDDCDAVACSVKRPALEITVGLQAVYPDPPKPLAGDVKYSLKAPDSDAVLASGTIPKATGKIAVTLDAGYYQVVLEPQDPEEAKRRLYRLEPADSDVSIPVLAPAQAKFELAPPYKKVQCIGYWKRSGAYIGLDDPAITPYVPVVGDTALETKEKEAKHIAAQRKTAELADLDGRCGIMLDAVKKAGTATGVDPSSDVLKIFLAPEFYFRGKRGAYPLERIDQILAPTEPSLAKAKLLKAEMDKGAYADWLFVLGSAIGAIELDSHAQKSSETAGTIDFLPYEIDTFAWCRTAGPEYQVQAGWKLWAHNTSTEFAVTAAFDSTVNPPYTRRQIRLSHDAAIDAEWKCAVGEYGVSPVNVVNKQTILSLTCAGATPANGWELKQGGVRRPIGNVVAGAPTTFTVRVTLPHDAVLTFAGAAASIFDGPTEHAATLDSHVVTYILVTHTPGSDAEHAKANWRIGKTNGGALSVDPADSLLVKNAHKPTAPNTLALEMAEFPVLPSAGPFGLGDIYPLPHMETEKLVYLDATFGGPVTVSPNQILESNGVSKGVLKEGVLIGGNQYALDVWMRLDSPAGLTVGDPVVLSTPGEAEILNVALIRKGGAGTPTRADGGAQKELLVYKETISSVDFEGMDYAAQHFDKDGHNVVSLYGDAARRALPTVGAVHHLNQPPSQNVSGTNTSAGQRIDEFNRSGLGGGSIFNMDGITFGVEVCLDHLAQKLYNYFNGSTKAAKPGDAMVEVQLIPSCGMSIKPPSICCVPDGIVFNVDAYTYGCKKVGGGTDATKLSETDLTTADVDKYFLTNGTAGNGKIEVYEPIDRPTPTAVV